MPPPIAEAAMQRAYARGTLVHAVAEALANGDILPHPIGDIDDYAEGVRRWFIDAQPTVLFTERRIVAPSLALTGRIDLGVLLDGWPTIVDYATGTVPPHKGMQVAGYQQLAETNADLQRMRRAAGQSRWKRAILSLPGNGRYKYYGESELDENDAYYFRAALALVRWRYAHGIITTTDPEQPDDDGARTLSRENL